MTDLRQAAQRALDAWDETVLPKSHDGMMQERMEALRAALAEPQEPVAWLVTGPYEKRAFSDLSGAIAYCRGLNKGFGEDAYKVTPLVPYAVPQAQPQCTDERMCVGCYTGTGCKMDAEAPAQAEPRKDRLEKVRKFIQADAELARGVTSKPEAHPIPPQWREAMKVAREALRAVRINMLNNAPELSGKSWGYLDAALAQLDALGGVE